MPPLSLNKILIAVLGFLALAHLKEIFIALAPVGWWFHDSLMGLYDFPRGAQTAIAFLSLVLVIVLIVKHLERKQ